MTSELIKLQKRAAIITVLLVAVLLALGCWQVFRLQWKTELLATIDARMAAPAVPLPRIVKDPASWEYRRVIVRGSYGKDRFLLKPRTENGKAGFHVVVPLSTAAQTVFVNRGFADTESYDAIKWPKRIVKVEGFITLPKKGAFTPDNNPEKNDWYWADIPAMAERGGIKNAAPILVVAGDVKPAIANNHLQYAIFWFGMALVLCLVYFLWRRKNGHGKL